LHAKYLKAWISYEGLQRIETFPVPESALREAVLNAVVHKDYAIGAPIQISVYPDKLMIWNPGQLPPDWTMEKLIGKHSSLPFNPDVANAFFAQARLSHGGAALSVSRMPARKRVLPPLSCVWIMVACGWCFTFHRRLKRR
ncbi:MAG: ATP-binding protein, partial [Polaromonas sp.]